MGNSSGCLSPGERFVEVAKSIPRERPAMFLVQFHVGPKAFMKDVTGGRRHSTSVDAKVFD